MAKLLIIGDIHGRNFWKEPCQHIDLFDKVICLGDYHDPYPYQVSNETSLNMLKNEFVPMVNSHKDKFICLIGNHDVPYISNKTSGSRFDVQNAPEITNLLKQLDLKLFYIEGKYLFSHSGVLPVWVKRHSYKNFIDYLNSLNVFSNDLNDVSIYRGGEFEGGSCIWGDVREYADLGHYPKYYQIFGHTQMHKELILKDFASLDCREAFILDTESEKIVSWENYKQTINE